ncbi:MAG: NB-ARC domain-containing protein [Actinomycetota bacterium]|nr:NB-ARC domain-containing protein [Actinomycetota bacterium]MDQ2956790.1 NB-ARC domain-containing protein [Actinomycetota bacterium]
MAAQTSEVPSIRFGILGPLSVQLDDRPVCLGPLKQQLVLAMLLCRANAVTSVDLLTDTLWGDEPPRTARKNLQVYVACLRKLLGTEGDGDRLTHHNGGYLLRVSVSELDVLRFQQLVAAARAAGQLHGAPAIAAGLGEALRLWRGPVLDGLASGLVVGGEASRLSTKYLAVFEDWAEAELTIGNAGAVVERVCEVAALHPFRERLRQIQMTALQLAGRQTEALSVFDELRQGLARELGLRPSPALERLYRTMLSGEPVVRPVRPTPAPASAPAAAPVPARSRTVLPPDLADFTGREDLLRRLGDRHPQVTVLTGPVGMGKTALAVRAAHQAGGSFPDGRILLSLRTGQGTTRSTVALLQELARFAGLPGAPELADPDELAGRWQSWLLEHRLLLVLDDARDERTVRTLLPAAGDSEVLVTARRRLAGLEYAERIEVPPLELAEAVALLGRIVGADRVRDDTPAAERIVLAAGLFPLAIRTAGAKLSCLRHLPLAEFAARLDEPDDLLDELSTGDSVLRNRLAAGLADLEVAEQAALRRLGSLATPWFTLDQAVEVLAELPGRARRLLESLIEANAVTAPVAEVTAHAAVYELPRLLRCYTRELP